MKELYLYLKEHADPNPTNFPVDWAKVEADLLLNRDIESRKRIDQAVRQGLEDTLIILNGAPPHVYMAIPELTARQIGFVPHYVSKIGRSDHSAKDTKIQLGRIKAVFQHLGYDNLGDFLSAQVVDSPKSVAYALMEVPPHNTGQPKNDDFTPLRSIVERRDQLGIRRILYIQEDIDPTVVLGDLGSPKYNGIPAFEFLKYCKDQGVKVDIKPL